MKNILLLFLLVSGFVAQAQMYNGNRQMINREEQLNNEYCTSMFKTAHGTVFDLPITSKPRALPIFFIGCRAVWQG
jgi:hypothetical protein